MWRIQISLVCVLLGVLLLEITIFPFVWSSLRIDLFLGMVIGLVVYSPFVFGFCFVFIASLMLQAFSGARMGYLPFAYVLAYFFLDMMKGLIFLENILAQCILGCLLNLAIVYTAGLFVNMDILQEGWLPLLAGAGLTGMLCPGMAYIVKWLWSGYEV